MTFVCYNGTLAAAGSPLFSEKNRAFAYGDGLFETIRLMDGKLLFVDNHLDRLYTGMNLLKMVRPPVLSPEIICTAILDLAEKNNLEGNGRIRIQIYRKEGGRYTPETNEINFIIEAEPLEHNKYLLNEKGLSVEIFREVPKPVFPLSNLKTSSALCQVLAGIFAKENNYGDCLMLNTQGTIAEAISSNVFIVKGDEWFTPPLEDGCVAGIMRMKIISLLRKENIQVKKQSLETEDLLEADEIFLTNVISGIRWVGAFRNRRYFSKKSKWLVEKFNSLVVQ